MNENTALKLRLALLQLANLIALDEQRQRAHPTRRKALTSKLKAARTDLVALLKEAA